jgi:internalin A
MTNEWVMQLVREAYKKNLTELDLSKNQLTQLPLEVTELKNLVTLNLSHNKLTQLPPEIKELKNLTTLNLFHNRLAQLPLEILELKYLIVLNVGKNKLTQLPSEIGKLKKLTTLDLGLNPLTKISTEIGELINLTELNLSRTELTRLPPEIKELKNLRRLNLSRAQLTRLPPEIGELKNLTDLYLKENQLTNLPLEIKELKSLIRLNLSKNNLIQLPPEIGELEKLSKLDLSWNQLALLPPEIGELKNLTVLYLDGSVLTQIPPEIGELKNLTRLNLCKNKLIQLPPEIGELENLTELKLYENQLTRIPPEIGDIKNLAELNLSDNQLTQLPPEIKELKSLITLSLSGNQLTKLPAEISELKNLVALHLSENPLMSPPPEIVSMGISAIFTYLRQLKITENNEAKLILVGDPKVGKTCLAYKLVTDNFLEKAKKTDRINIYKWIISTPDHGNSKIRINIWDFARQDIYHATHQFFLTKRSVYLLVWNAREKKDYDNIYYWLHTIEAFGGDSPILLVMSKLNESNDDLNLRDIRNQFPQIAGYLKIDSKDGKGIPFLKEEIHDTAWNLSLTRTSWADSWYKVREKLERLRENWIPYEEFYRICISEGLDDENINTLDGYLHELGITLHFKDRVALKNIVILKPEWATGSFYGILSAKSVLHDEGILSYNELDQIWDEEIYPSSIHSQMMELMNIFELSYELPDKKSYLIPELLPKRAPNFTWDERENLCFYYCYDHFLPAEIITRFIVRMHQNIEIAECETPLCWKEGTILNLQNSRALVMMEPDERQIEIRIKGDNNRGALGAICSQLDQINASIKKINVIKKIPCSCSENCPQKYFYEDLLKAEMENVKKIQCHKSYKNIQISTLLEGYRKVKKSSETSESTGKTSIKIVNKPKVRSEAKSIAIAKQKTDASINLNIDLKIDLPQIQTEFNKLNKEIRNLNPELKSELDEIQGSLDEVSANSETERLNKPLNKVRRLLEELNDPDSNYNKVITGTEKGIEYAQKIGRTYNKIAPLFGMPKVPEPLL